MSTIISHFFDESLEKHKKILKKYKKSVDKVKKVIIMVFVIS
jgi:hypothetical protein